MGMDVSHAAAGDDRRQSIAAVVASMDNKASQYAAHISAQAPRQEMIGCLEDAVVSLLNTYRSKNGGRMPETVIVFRDGVSDGQFEQVTNIELPAVKSALESLGFPEVKVAVVVCQKGHHTRLVYEERGHGGSMSYVNPCPGLCVDSNGGDLSITSGWYNEFYLNSHTAIQGTAKPCKYSLVYDEIGLKIAELELLTYWTTYLYCRCNKSVSLAAPAYYAHWASKRGAYLMANGGVGEDLLQISREWGQDGRPNTMFFI